MRSTLAVATLLALLTITPALAGSSTMTDASWDQFVVDPAENAAGSFACRDAATDLRSVSVDSADGELVVSLVVADLGSHHVTCDFVGSQPAVLQLWDVRMRPMREPVCGELTCSTPEPDVIVTFAAARMGSDAMGCAYLRFADGPGSECLGGFEMKTTDLTWRMPLAGTVLVENGDTRTFQLAGEPVVPHASSQAYFDVDFGLGLGFGLANLDDDFEAAWETEPTVL